MRLLKTLTKMIKYYIPLHLSTLFIFSIYPDLAIVFYFLGLMFTLYLLIKGINFTRYLTYLVIAVLLITIFRMLGTLIAMLVILLILFLWRDLMILLR